ncbi:MAG: DsbA family protein [Gemmatimonadota bacterium]|nr:DsbA family protein [Gemmatimonadota bacterium]
MKQSATARLLNWLTVAMTVTALVAVAAWIWQARHQHPSVPPPSLQRITDWREYGTGGIGHGDPAAPVTVVMFSDYQCPFCSAAFADLEKLAVERPQLLRIIYRNYPLTVHTHAMAAALSAVCANNQHIFLRYSQLLFSHQNTIGQRSWASFASEAGANNLPVFEACLTDPRTAAIVAADTLAGTRIGIKGTPTILVNDLMVDGYPGKGELDGYIRAAGGSSGEPH